MMILIRKNPALSSHSQWFTLAQRILCLDVHTARPSFAVRWLTTAVIKFYTQSWLRIKCHPLSTNGPKNFHFMVTLLKYLNATEKRTAKAAIQRNAFHGHPENLLLAMLVDEDPDMCQKHVKQLNLDNQEAVHWRCGDWRVQWWWSKRLWGGGWRISPGNQFGPSRCSP